jgi:hypothetical protein
MPGHMTRDAFMDERKEQQVRKAWKWRKVLDAWAACVVGSEPAMPGIGYPTRRTADHCGDEYLAYVRTCSVPGYQVARPVLIHHIAHGRPLETFRVVEPGESVRDALNRLGWRDLMIFPPSDALLVGVADMAWWRWSCFKRALKDELHAEPYFGAMVAYED